MTARYQSVSQASPEVLEFASRGKDGLFIMRTLGWLWGDWPGGNCSEHQRLDGLVKTEDYVGYQGKRLRIPDILQPVRHLQTASITQPPPEEQTVWARPGSHRRNNYNYCGREERGERRGLTTLIITFVHITIYTSSPHKKAIADITPHTTHQPLPLIWFSWMFLMVVGWL